METVKLEHLPSTYTAHIALFQNVANAEFLHKQLLARNEAFEYAFIDATVIVSRLQLLSAIFRASNLAVSNSLKTPNVHSEIVTSLSNSNNVCHRFPLLPLHHIIFSPTFPNTPSFLTMKIIHNSFLLILDFPFLFGHRSRKHTAGTEFPLPPKTSSS